MGRLKYFLGKYWLTFCICASLISLYVFATETGRANPYLFPRVGAIRKVFAGEGRTMFVNLLASMKLMIRRSPSRWAWRCSSARSWV